MCFSPLHTKNIELKIEMGKSTKEWSTKLMKREECKNVSIINEHILKCQAESDNKPKENVST